jgi:hypothetical protein
LPVTGPPSWSLPVAELLGAAAMAGAFALWALTLYFLGG